MEPERIIFIFAGETDAWGKKVKELIETGEEDITHDIVKLCYKHGTSNLADAIIQKGADRGFVTRLREVLHEVIEEVELYDYMEPEDYNESIQTELLDILRHDNVTLMYLMQQQQQQQPVMTDQQRQQLQEQISLYNQLDENQRYLEAQQQQQQQQQQQPPPRVAGQRPAGVPSISAAEATQSRPFTPSSSDPSGDPARLGLGVIQDLTPGEQGVGLACFPPLVCCAYPFPLLFPFFV